MPTAGLDGGDELAGSTDSEAEDQSAAHTHQDATQRRRVQNAKFEALLSKHAQSVTAEDVKAALKSTADFELSTANLLAKQDFAAVITEPREYQIELFERAKIQNTIAVLDTGSTFSYPMVEKVDSVALVHQQAAVLRNNLDQTVAHFFGAMGTDLWNKQMWDEHFSQNMVIVCTAEILHQCLLNAHIRMDQINLLIFDEAHHTKKDHPYARIIKDSYLRVLPSQRPRILGMTASPIDAKGDVVKAAS
ncbi:hypothetical protein VTN02DRAFT_1518 [Thermoascus thermophilus]